MWNILIQKASQHVSQKDFKQLIKDQQVAICLQLCSYLQSNLQLCRSLYTQCTEIPQLWDVEKVMWNILIQTACSYTIGKYFKWLIKYQKVAICLQLCSYLQSNLQLCRTLYTWCTEFPQLWDVEKVMWNILIQTACSYTSEKYFKQLIKYQQVAICLQLYSYLYSNLQLCCTIYTFCTQFPQLWDVEKVMWSFPVFLTLVINILKSSVKISCVNYVAMCTWLLSYLEITLMLSYHLYGSYMNFLSFLVCKITHLQQAETRDIMLIT